MISPDKRPGVGKKRIATLLWDRMVAQGHERRFRGTHEEVRSTFDFGKIAALSEPTLRANTRHPNTCEPNPERFAQEERSRAVRFSGNSPVGGREYGSRANQELQALVRILTLPAALSVRLSPSP